jgi:hypothetical protein
LLAARALAGGVGFAERAAQIVGNEAPHFVDLDMLVLLSAQQVLRQLLAAGALASFEDHGVIRLVDRGRLKVHGASRG